MNDNATLCLSVLAVHLGMKAGIPTRGARKPRGLHLISGWSSLVCPIILENHREERHCSRSGNVTFHLPLVGLWVSVIGWAWF